MKKITRLLTAAVLAASIQLNGQVLFKDLIPGPHPASSNTEQYMDVNGTMFFLARVNSSSQFNHQLWKSDGTPAGTVMVKDSLIVTNVGNTVQLCANVNGVLYFSVTPYSPTSTYSPQLWKSDGTTAGTVLVTTLTYTTGTGACPPKNFTPLGNQLFFNFGLNNGRELWVTDGTAAGTVEVTDLAPGTSGTQQVPGVEDKPMIAYNGKVYFSGCTTLGDFELYASDGTAAGTTLVQTLRPGPGSASPGDWIIFNNELYLDAASGSGNNLWKTDGITTTQLTTGVNVRQPVVFKNELYFPASIALWKTDGTVAGTVLVKDSVSTGGFVGGNSNYLFCTYQQFIPTPPYYITHNYRTDGTAAGTAEVSYDVFNSASFSLINDNMYIVRLDSGSFTNVGLWVSDGTAAGTSKLFNGYGTGFAFVFNNDVFFSNYDAANGYELWHLGQVNGVAEHSSEKSLLYPNPTSGKFTLRVTGNEPVAFEVYDAMGERVQQQRSAEFDLSAFPKGMYFVKINEGKDSYFEKVLVE